MMQAEMAGDIVLQNERGLFQSMDTGLNWVRELEDYMDLYGGADYTMAPPHVGLMSQGIICNALNPTGVGNVVLAIDISGSINREKLNLAVTHLELFAENIDYESIRVIACASTIRYDRTFERGETLDLSDMPVGGGTAFRPVFNRIEEGDAPDLFIYFTDMQTDDMHDYEDPGYPIIWLVDSDIMLDENGDWDEFACRRTTRYTPDFGHRINACQ
jgi:hypothetical protein